MLVQWFNSLPVASQAALIGAVIGALAGALANIATGVLRDFVAEAWTDRREAKRSADEVYRRYAEPLSSAVTSLLWRLKETLGRDGRGSYLAARDPKTVFEDYKLRSTYYGLAAVLGWVRALRRELSFFRHGDAGRLDKIEDAIANLEASLADGHHVELQRLDGLVQIWGLSAIRDNQLGLRVAVEIEIAASERSRALPSLRLLTFPRISRANCATRSPRLSVPERRLRRSRPGLSLRRNHARSDRLPSVKRGSIEIGRLPSGTS